MNYKASHYPATRTFDIYKIGVNLFIFLGFTCFTLSLFLPVFFTSAEEVYGYWVLIIGWLGVIFIQFAWFANPLNCLALLLTNKHPRVALCLSLLALLIASEGFILLEIPTGINQEKVFVKEFGLGFYAWYVAHCCFLLAILSRYFCAVKQRYG